MPPLAVVPDLEEELDRLYGLPAEEFTAARNDLAARLRKAGQAEAAEQVRGLARPTVSAWAVNRLAREAPEEVGKLLDAGQALRRAQARALGGRGSDELQAASREESEALRALTAKARRILGGKGGKTALDRIAATLRAAAVDDEGRKLLERGRLERDLEPTGFELLAGMPIAPRRKPPAKKDTMAIRQRVRELRKEANALRKRADDAERTARDAREAADAAERALAEAEAELE